METVPSSSTDEPMRAALIVERGGPEGRIVAEHPVPEVGPQDVLVRVRACSLNHLDVFVRKGVAGAHLPLPHISGGDIAGEVARRGSDVTEVQVGDRVLIDPLVGGKALGEDLQGGLAEYASVPAKNCIALPEGLAYVPCLGSAACSGAAWPA